MPSLNQLLERHQNILVLDAASSCVQVGVVDRGGARMVAENWKSIQAEAGVGLFLAVKELKVDLDRVDAFAFCGGPGSILGIRTAAMAIRTWCALRARPVFAYGSLALVAHAAADRDLAVIADARRDAWHEFTLAAGLRRVPAGQQRAPAVTPAGFRHWRPLPPGTVETSYEVPALLARAADADLFRETAAPDAFLHEEPTYAAWTPAVHQAPAR